MRTFSIVTIGNVKPDSFGVGALGVDGTVVFVVGAFMGVE